MQLTYVKEMHVRADEVGFVLRQRHLTALALPFFLEGRLEEATFLQSRKMDDDLLFGRPHDQGDRIIISVNT